MRLFRRGRGRAGNGSGDADEAHLAAFAARHSGVEAFIEPRTAVTETTLMLVAGTGEWTRRRVAGPQAAFAFGRRVGVPVYEAGVVGYPRRMREWNRARAREAAGGRADPKPDEARPSQDGG